MGRGAPSSSFHVPVWPRCLGPPRGHRQITSKALGPLLGRPDLGHGRPANASSPQRNATSGRGRTPEAARIQQASKASELCEPLLGNRERTPLLITRPARSGPAVVATAPPSASRKPGEYQPGTRQPTAVTATAFAVPSGEGGGLWAHASCL